MRDSQGTEDGNRTDERSVSTSLEHLVTASQRVITNRIDLALLEGREQLSHGLQSAALAGIGIFLLTVAWLALSSCLILLVLPDANWLGRLAAFGLINAAAGLVTLALRGSRAAVQPRRSESEEGLRRGPLAAARKS